MQLNAVVLHWPRRASAQRSAAEAARLAQERRFGTADGRARRRRRSWPGCSSSRRTARAPGPFLWNGRDYLLKMSDDLDFVSEAAAVRRRRLACFCRGNPSLLTRMRS